MKVHYFLEYLSMTTNKGVRADLGYDIYKVAAAAYIHLKQGDLNIVIVPVLENCEDDDEDNINIIDLDNVELKPDEVKEDAEIN